MSTDRINSAILGSSASAKRRQTAKSIQVKRTNDSGRKLLTRPPGFTVQFSLSGAIRSVRKQEKEAFRPTIKPVKVTPVPTLKQTVPKKKRPILKRFVFDFETRKWKPEFVVEGKDPITADFLVPETPVISDSKNRLPAAAHDSRAMELGFSYKNPSLTSSLQSINSASFNQREDQMYYMESGLRSGRETSQSDVSTGESSSDVTETSRSVHSDVLTRELEAILEASARRGGSRLPEDQDTRYDHLDIHGAAEQEVRRKSLVEEDDEHLAMPEFSEQIILPTAQQGVDKLRRAWEIDPNADDIQETIDKLSDHDDKHSDICINNGHLTTEDVKLSSVTESRRESMVHNHHNAPDVKKDLQNKRFRILDAETKEDIGKMR